MIRSLVVCTAFAVVLAMPACTPKTESSGNHTSSIAVEHANFEGAAKTLNKSESPSAVIFAKALTAALTKQGEKTELYIPDLSIEQNFCIDKWAVKSVYDSAQSLNDLAQPISANLSQSLDECEGETTCIALGDVPGAVQNAAAHMFTANQHIEAYNIGADMGSNLGDINTIISAAQKELEDWVLSHSGPADAIYDANVDGLGMINRLLEQEAQTARRKAWEGAPFAYDIDDLLTDLVVDFRNIEALARQRRELEGGAAEAYGSVVSDKIVDILARLNALEEVSVRAHKARQNCTDDIILQIGRTAGLLNNFETTINSCLEEGTCSGADAAVESKAAEVGDEMATEFLAERLKAATAEIKRASKG